MSRPATSCARRKQETASSYCSRKRELTIASRKLWQPMFAVYQLGRGSEPMIEVGSSTSADALYICAVSLRGSLSTHRILRVLQRRPSATNDRAPARAPPRRGND